MAILFIISVRIFFMDLFLKSYNTYLGKNVNIRYKTSKIHFNNTFKVKGQMSQRRKYSKNLAISF